MTPAISPAMMPPQNIFAQRLALPPQPWGGAPMPPVSGPPGVRPMPVGGPGMGQRFPQPMPVTMQPPGTMPPTAMMPPRPGMQPVAAQLPQNAMRQRLMMTA